MPRYTRKRGTHSTSRSSTPSSKGCSKRGGSFRCTTLQQKGRVFSLYDVADEAFPPEVQERDRKGLEYIGAQLLVPLTLKGDLIGLIALGNKESGTFFSADDSDFLYTLANQSTL